MILSLKAHLIKISIRLNLLLTWHSFTKIKSQWIISISLDWPMLTPFFLTPFSYCILNSRYESYIDTQVNRLLKFFSSIMILCNFKTCVLTLCCNTDKTSPTTVAEWLSCNSWLQHDIKAYYQSSWLSLSQTQQNLHNLDQTNN